MPSGPQLWGSPRFEREAMSASGAEGSCVLLLLLPIPMARRGQLPVTFSWVDRS